MAKPDTDRGWVQLAYELDAAFGYSDFSKPAQAIIRMIRGQVYGHRKLVLARLSVAEVVARTGQRRQNVERALREVIDSGAITSPEPDAYSIAKDYETWTRRETPRDYTSPKIPRLSAAEIADSKAAPSYAAGPKTAQSRLNPNGFRKGTQSDSPDESKRIQEGIQLDADLNPNGCQSESKRIHPHIDEARTASGDLETLETNTPGGRAISNPRTEDDQPPKPLPAAPPAPDAADKIAARIAGHYREAPDDNGEHYRAEALMWLAAHPGPVVDLAVTRAIAKTTSRSGAGLCRLVPSMLADAARDIGRTSAPASPPGGPRPAPMTNSGAYAPFVPPPLPPGAYDGPPKYMQAADFEAQRRPRLRRSG